MDGRTDGRTSGRIDQRTDEWKTISEGKKFNSKLQVELLMEEVPKSPTWGSSGLGHFSVKPHSSLWLSMVWYGMVW